MGQAATLHARKVADGAGTWHTLWCPTATSTAQSRGGHVCASNAPSRIVSYKQLKFVFWQHSRNFVRPGLRMLMLQLEAVHLRGSQW